MGDADLVDRLTIELKSTLATLVGVARHSAC